MLLVDELSVGKGLAPGSPEGIGALSSPGADFDTQRVALELTALPPSTFPRGVPIHEVVLDGLISETLAVAENASVGSPARIPPPPFNPADAPENRLTEYFRELDRTAIPTQPLPTELPTELPAKFPTEDPLTERTAPESIAVEAPTTPPVSEPTLDTPQEVAPIATAILASAAEMQRVAWFLSSYICDLPVSVVPPAHTDSKEFRLQLTIFEGCQFSVPFESIGGIQDVIIGTKSISSFTFNLDKLGPSQSGEDNWLPDIAQREFKCVVKVEAYPFNGAWA